MKDKRLFVVVHEHRFGTSTYMVRSKEMPSEDLVIEKCEIDFEADRGEVITIAEVDEGDIVKQLSVSAKLGYTYYADRDVVGTDLEEIEGNIKADIYTLLRWKF